MKYGLDVPTMGEYADARVLARLAADAEAAGWDGFFVWDVLLGTEAVLDLWIALTAIALSTERVRIGALASPLARHRPWLAAQRLANLDHLSHGRVVCAVGLGYSECDFAAFGEPDDAVLRAEKLDEGLDVLTGLWNVDEFSYSGRHYTVDRVTLLPGPVQAPRIPIWVAGGWPRRAPFRRAARWDGVCIKSTHHDTREWLTLDDIRACVAYVQAQREHQGPFEVITSGEMADDRRQAIDMMRALEAVGATWWVEEGLGWSLAEFRERVRHGPPRAAEDAMRPS